MARQYSSIFAQSIACHSISEGDPPLSSRLSGNLPFDGYLLDRRFPAAGKPWTLWELAEGNESLWLKESTNEAWVGGDAAPDETVDLDSGRTGTVGRPISDGSSHNRNCRIGRKGMAIVV